MVRCHEPVAVPSPPSGELHSPPGRSRLRRLTTIVLVAGCTLAFLYHHGVMAALGLAASADGTASYAFKYHQPGRPDQPVTYSPCKAIHVVVNDAVAPPGGYELVTAALDQVHAASNLTFVVDGHTNELPTDDSRSPNGVDWPPVLIAWSTPDQAPTLEGRVDGYGGSASTTDPQSGHRYYVTGRVALDAPQLAGELARPGGKDAVRGVIVHELGHVLGLAHVDDRDETMYRSARRDGQLGPGDRLGFALVGSGQCYG